MREILFRGKRIDNGEWVYGHYGEYIRFEKPIPAISIPSDDSFMGNLCYDVDPSTVGQFTGLTDKNGKKIFEGDIVFNNMTGRKLIGYLEERAAFCFCDKCITSPAFIGQYNFEYFEVIGNIHDNPELLEVGE